MYLIRDSCPKLVDSNKLDPAVGTLLYLGECYERNGQTASAWVTFQVAAETAQKGNQPERARVASDRANALVPTLSKITITVAEAVRVPGLEVKRDGVDVGQATWGVSVPLDPGEHVITAKAPGKKDWSQTVRIEADGKATAVDIPVLEGAAAPQPPITVAAPTQVAQPFPADTKMDQGPPASHGNSQRVMAFVAGGVGVVGLLTGTVFGLEAKSKQNQSQSHCESSDPTACDQQGVDLRHTGHTDAMVANVGFAVGALGLIGGAALYFTAPSNSAQTTAAADTRGSLQRVTITPAIGTQSSSLLVSGRF